MLTSTAPHAHKATKPQRSRRNWLGGMCGSIKISIFSSNGASRRQPWSGDSTDAPGRPPEDGPKTRPRGPEAQTIPIRRAFRLKGRVRSSDKSSIIKFINKFVNFVYKRRYDLSYLLRGTYFRSVKTSNMLIDVPVSYTHLTLPTKA